MDVWLKKYNMDVWLDTFSVKIESQKSDVSRGTLACEGDAIEKEN